MHSNPKIYLLGANNRATHTLAEVYKKNKFTVCVISWHENNIRFSKFVDEFILLPDAEKDFVAFKNEFINIFKNLDELLLPVNDIAVLICLQCKAALLNRVKIIGLNDPVIQEFAINKYTLLLLAKECNIDYPETIYIDSLNEFEKQKKAISFPVIAKPVSSRLLKGGAILSFHVKMFNDIDQLSDFVRENINTIPLMLQEYLKDGYGIGLNFIASNGELTDYYFHKRLHEAWGGGESSYRKTITGDPFGLLGRARAFIKLMGWNGVGMLEFRIANDKAYLMELNGRFWGSIKLGVYAGKNFPMQLLNLENTGKKNIEHKPGEFYARNFKMEVSWLLKGIISQKKYSLPFTWFWNFRKALRSNEIIEDNLFNDFRYRFLDLIDIIRIPFQKRTSRSALKKQSDILWNKISGRSYTPKQGDNIVFICKGNICRSPFAEAYAKKNYPQFIFHSSGFIGKAERLPPLNAVAAASKYDIDIYCHKSSNIDSIDKKNISAWIVMDKENLMSLINETDESNIDKIYSLGGHDEIRDPFSQNVEYFDSIFSQIVSHINRIFQIKTDVGM